MSTRSSALLPIALTAAALGLLGACATGSDDSTVATGIPTKPTTEPTTPASPAPTPTATSAPAATAVPTTPSTDVPTTSVPAGTVPTTDPPAPSGPSTVITMDGLDLVERDVATGEVVATLVEGFAREATYPADFTLVDGRARMVFDEFVEDSWFACEASPGSVHEVDLTTGARNDLGPGSAPAVSPDDGLLAHLAASQCLPDPDEPQFVVTPYDTVVVVDRATGTRVEHRLPDPPTDWDAPEALAWVGFESDGALLVSTNAGTLHRIPAVDLLGAGVDPTAVVVDGIDLEGAHPVDVAGSSLVVTVVGAEGSHDVSVVDLVGGSAVLAVASEYPVQVGVSDDGVVLVGHDPRDGTPTVAAGAPAVVVPVPPGDEFGRVLGGIAG